MPSCLCQQVKLILKFMTYVAYNSLLELCFAMDEFAMPPPGSEELAENMEGFDSSTDVNPIEFGREEPMDIAEMKENQDLSNPFAKVRDMQFVLGDTLPVGEKEDISKACDNAMEYTSFVETTEEDAGKENVVPPTGESAVQGGTSLELPVTMKRQLSEAMELTDCSDPLLGYQKHQDDSIFRRSQSIQFQEQKETMSHQFRHSLHGTILSVSPYIKYSIPYLESEPGAKCFVRKYLPDDIYWSASFAGEKVSKEQRLSKAKYMEMEYGGRYSVSSNIKITEAHPFVLSEMTAPANDNSTLVQS